MASDPGIVIVSIEGVDDVEAKKRLVSKIRGVVGVDYNLLTQKLIVTYQGDHGTKQEIETKLKSLLRLGRQRPMKQSGSHGRSTAGPS